MWQKKKHHPISWKRLVEKWMSATMLPRRPTGSPTQKKQELVERGKNVSADARKGEY